MKKDRQADQQAAASFVETCAYRTLRKDLLRKVEITSIKNFLMPSPTLSIFYCATPSRVCSHVDRYTQSSEIAMTEALTVAMMK